MKLETLKIMKTKRSNNYGEQFKQDRSSSVIENHKDI